MNKKQLSVLLALATIATNNKDGFTVNAVTLQPITTGYAVAVAETQNSFGLEGLANVVKYVSEHSEINAFGGWDSVISSIHEELAGYDFEFMPSSECDRIWKEAWNGDKSVHLPEVKYNHAIEYANRLLAIWEN